jgi:hypothetical protein
MAREFLAADRAHGTLPYACGALVTILVAANSDRVQERKWHMLGATALSGVFLLMAPLAHAHGILAFLTLAVAGVGIVNGAGNLGGTVGPYFFGAVREVTGSFAQSRGHASAGRRA